jgi:hypothetical protein
LWRRGQVHTVFDRERDRLKDLGVDGSIILKCILIKYNIMPWTDDRAQDRSKWWPVMNTVMNIQFP